VIRMTAAAAPGLESLRCRLARLVAAIDEWPRWWVMAFTYLLVATLIAGDFITTASLAFTALYLVPIFIGAWFFGSPPFGVALVCATSGLMVSLTTREPTPSMVALGWEYLTQVAVFSAMAFVMHRLRRALVEERKALVIEHQRSMQTQQQLEHAQRLSTVGKLTAGLAHELGTPLHVTGSYAKLLEDGAVDAKEVSQTARVMRQQVESMTRIIRQLVDFSRAGRTEKSEHDLRDITKATLGMMLPLARKKEIALSLADGPPQMANVDAAKLQQVLSNLVLNAIYAAPQRGRVDIALASSTAATLPNGTTSTCAIIEVRDNGEGIAPEILARLFEPFATTKPIGEGSGLGLAVAMGIVRDHDGWITGTNIAQGACFTVYLPSW
jgi:two-component system, NtrC family, sensor kinase